jgi:putative glutamine amidotransferase
VSSILMTCRDLRRLEQNYVPALQHQGWKGGLVIATPEAPVSSLEGVAGLMLAGGNDIHPRHWDPSEPVHPTAEVDEARDALELPLIRQAWQRRIPILGICRGEQILNVALGGSLIQDIPSHFHCPGDRHSHGTPDEPELHHGVSLQPDSRLAQLLGTLDVQVNSRHHQAVQRLAPGFKAVAWHPETHDGQTSLIEAIEAEDPTRWAFGVQWHPENLVGFGNGAGEAARQLFRAFVAAVRSQVESL